VPDVFFVDKASLLDRVEVLWQAQGSITRQEAAIVFWILTQACLTLPSRHPLRFSSIIDLDKKADQWMKVANSLQHPPLAQMSRYEMLLDVALHALEAVYHTFQSNFEGNWQSTGAGIRRATALHLFSSNHRQRQMIQSDGQGVIIINTFHLAQKLQIMDRWIAFTDLRALGIHPSDVVKWDLSSEAPCLRAWIEGIQVKLLEDARDFVIDCERGRRTKLKLSADLNVLLTNIDDESSRVIARYTSQTAISFDPALCALGQSGSLAAVLVSWLMACAFIGCSAAMPFACEYEAPLADRMASLRCASNLMSLVPILTSVYRHGMQALRVSRLSNHLFYALRAVVLTLVGLDLQPSVTERKGDEALLLGRSNWAQSLSRVSPEESSSSLEPFIGDLELLQSQFSNSMNLLGLFAEGGCRTAKRALGLVGNVLALHGTLSTTLKWTPVNESSMGDKDKIRTAFANDWSLARSGLQPETVRITAGMETAQLPQTALDAMLCQAPQINFLSPDDIDHIFSNFISN
jgi:hypothetical protein